MRGYWNLDPTITFLNHGSFGACPRAVLDEQSRLRAEMEADPVDFLSRSLGSRLDAALEPLGGFIGARPADLAFVPNATAGVNAVLRSLDFASGEEILVTNHAYEACRNAAQYVAARTGARVVVADVPFPAQGPEEVLEAVLRKAGPRVRLALLDHVTSITALVLPIAPLVATLAERGIDTLVDGAHAPGMLPLDLSALGAAYYAGNCHKWMCAPKGAGFLHVRGDRQGRIAPAAVSSMASWARPGASPFRQRFDWTGTNDPTAALCVPFAIEHLASLRPGGWPGIMDANRALALRARKIVCGALDVEPAAPDSMIGAMASVLFRPATKRDGLDERLWREARIEVPVVEWGDAQLCRLSAQLYNAETDFHQLAGRLRALGL